MDRVRSIERDEVRIEGVGQASCGRPPRPPRARGPPGRGISAARPSCVETARDEIGVAHRLGRCPTDRCDARHRAARAAEKLTGAVRARHDDPVVPCNIDRLVRERLDPDQRAVHDIVAEGLQAHDQVVLLPGRPGDDQPHRAAASNSAAIVGGILTRATLEPRTVLVSDQPGEHRAVVERGHGREAAASDERDTPALCLDPCPRLARRRPARRDLPRRHAPEGRARPVPPPGASPLDRA